MIACVLAVASETSGIWLDVPFVQQEKNGCGAASIAMLLQYWRLHENSIPDLRAEEIMKEIYSAGARGIHASGMEGYLRAQGFRTFQIRGQWEDLRQHLEKGRPVIVALSAGNRALHYVVVAGLDWKKDIILKNDPADRKLRQQSKREFEQQWKAAGNWMLLAVPGAGGEQPRAR